MQENEIGYIWDEALPEIIPDLDWDKFSAEQWSEISKALNGHVDASRDFMAPVPSSYDMAEMNYGRKVRELEATVERLEAELRVYGTDIRRVHGGLSTHADLNAERVVITDRWP